MGSVVLSIPAWHIALYIAISAVFLLMQQRKLSLITTYVFSFYWAFYIYADEFVMVASDSALAMSSYILCGMLLVVLSLVAFLQERS
ncbi:MAG: hypothetical protein GTO40_24890 [Deltaproteobacteria bacterium]|nr:hypothetical protein [Deltaproteobacteria bacterium]